MKSMNEIPAIISGDGASPQVEGPSWTSRRVVLIGLGDTGAIDVLDSGLFDDIQADLKNFVIMNSNVTAIKAILNAPSYRGKGEAHPIRVPTWARGEASIDDDFTLYKDFLHEDRSYSGDDNGMVGRHDGYIALVSDAELDRLLLDAVQNTGRRSPGEQGVVVYVVVVFFAGRGTGSGGLPALLKALGRTKRQLTSSLDMRVILGMQVPSVRVSNVTEYIERTITLLMELSVAQLDGLEIAPGQVLGGSRHSLPWFQAFVFGELPGKAGAEIDVQESARYLSSVIHARLDATIGAEIDALMPLRGGALLGLDPASGLPQMFSIMGRSELRYEPEAGVRIGEDLLWLQFLKAFAQYEAEVMNDGEY